MFKCSAVDIIMSHKSQLVIIVNYIITDTYTIAMRYLFVALLT
jgi:hypothetical protein